MLLRSVAAEPEGLIVGPDCVRVGGTHGFNVVSIFTPPLSVKLAGSPALVQLIARPGVITPAPACAWMATGRMKLNKTTSGTDKIRFISGSLALFGTCSFHRRANAPKTWR